jgi:tetratricopeptide (TPR) repeat protein
MAGSSSSRAVPYAQLGLCVAIVTTLIVAAEPVGQAAERPSDADHVIARVPARDSEAQRRLAALKDAATRAPGDRARAVSLARGYVEAARSEGDPRFLGAAEAALARFTSEADPAPEVRVLHATILQARHAFPEALSQLERALAARPDDAQAWLTQASVQTVRGDYGAARASCAHLPGLASAVYVASCTAPLDALTGHADEAIVSLEAVLRAVSAPRERALLESLRGELL